MDFFGWVGHIVVETHSCASLRCVPPKLSIRKYHEYELALFQIHHKTDGGEYQMINSIRLTQFRHAGACSEPCRRGEFYFIFLKISECLPVRTNITSSAKFS